MTRGIWLCWACLLPSAVGAELQPRTVQAFDDYIRSVEAGEIRALEVKNGLPFSMQIEHRPEPNGDQRRA